MKRVAFIIAVVIFQVVDVAEACGRRRACHSCHQRIVYQSRPMVYQAPIDQQAGPVTSPQITYVPMINPPQPMASQPVIAAQQVSGGVQPLYNYAAANRSQPAYYYTYDNSGKLVVSQWVDYLFRGGKAEGMPRPPLPVIGALRNRD